MGLVCQMCKKGGFTLLLVLSDYREDLGSYCDECYPIAARKLEEKREISRR
jgi:hypothetical protein